MRAGKLDRTIAIERQTETVNAAGSVASTWTNIATVRAELIQASAREFLEAHGETESTTIVFLVRYVAGITTDDRVTYAGATFDLVEIKEIGRRRGLELRCERIRK
jgi:SPP1 family predicted phage head-tail adaptor